MADKKRVLLTNDDGIFSPGLMTLARTLLNAGRYELRVAAPEREQSGVGHCITLHGPLYVQAVTLPGELAAAPAFQVSGTPADCVKIALTNLFPDFSPELVIAGINHGPNVGINALYSGTVAGALEACLNGLPALALSLDRPRGGLDHFTLASERSRPLIDAVLEHGLPPWSVLNVNLPNCPEADLLGVRLTRQGHSGFKEYYIEEPREGARRRFRLEGEMVFRGEDEASDAAALREGWISVTPLGTRMQDERGWRHVRGWALFRPRAGSDGASGRAASKENAPPR